MLAEKEKGCTFATAIERDGAGNAKRFKISRSFLQKNKFKKNFEFYLEVKNKRRIFVFAFQKESRLKKKSSLKDL